MTTQERLAQLKDDLRSLKTSLGTDGRTHKEDQELEGIIKSLEGEIEILQSIR